MEGPKGRWQAADTAYLANVPDEYKSKFALYFARIYSIRQGFRYSESNQLISNFKKDIEHSSRGELYYKGQAVTTFADELTELLRGIYSQRSSSNWEHAGTMADLLDQPEMTPALYSEPPSTILVPIPPSSRKDSPQYDDRVEKVASLVAERLPYVYCAPIVKTWKDRQPLRLSRHRRWQDVYESIEIDHDQPGLVESVVEMERTMRSEIVVLDDVLTSGASFYAVALKLKEELDIDVATGLFWARAEYVYDEYYDDCSF